MTQWICGSGFFAACANSGYSFGRFYQLNNINDLSQRGLISKRSQHSFYLVRSTGNDYDIDVEMGEKSLHANHK